MGGPPRSHCADGTGVAPLNVLFRGNRGRIDTARFLTGDAHQPYRDTLRKSYFGEFSRANISLIVHLLKHGQRLSSALGWFVISGIVPRYQCATNICLGSGRWHTAGPRCLDWCPGRPGSRAHLAPWSKSLLGAAGSGRCAYSLATSLACWR